MRRMALLLGGLLIGCPPVPQPQHRDADAAQLATPVSACSNLAAQGCLEGADPACPVALAKMIDAGIGGPIDLTCLTSATSKDAARACGGVSCP